MTSSRVHMSCSQRAIRTLLAEAMLHSKRVINSNHRSRASNFTFLDHAYRLVQRHPRYPLSLVDVRAADLNSSLHEIQILRRVRVSDHRLEGHHKFGAVEWPPASFLLHLPRR